MKEKIVKKLLFVETMKAVIDAVERVRNDYESNKAYYEKNAQDPDRDEYWKKSDLETADEYTKRIEAIDEIYAALYKMI